MKSGFLIIDKEEGKTSIDVDRTVKKVLHEKKVGHLGTLDPFATGLLIIGVNDATKLFTLIEEDKKTYTATLKLGKSTDTYDCLGKTIEEKEINPFTKDDILNVFESFKGKIEQIPPKYSAKHIDGKRAYNLALNGKEVVLKPQTIEIFSLDLLDYSFDTITFKTVVSKGTYIRTLGIDIAKKLNNLGYLSKLRRNKIGDIDERLSIEERDISIDKLIPINHFFNFKTIDIKEPLLQKKIRNGNPCIIDDKNEFVFFTIDDNIVALYKKEKESKYTCFKSFNHGNI